MPVQITVTHTVSDQTIRDIKSTAAEGGIDYWSDVEEYDYDRGLLKLVTDDPVGNDGDKVYDVTDDVIKAGIVAVLTSTKINDDVRGWVAEAVATDDATTIDAEAADVIVQLGLFGEVVYG